jgi:tRNA(Arg) A34 adenosine deaminase TadA
MTDEQYMRLAIDEAKKAETLGWTPLGVVIVKDGKIIVSGTSHVGEKLDPTAHGESWCMREACQKLQTLDLSGCTLYSTLESCSMCMGCAGWCGLSRIVFGAYKEDAPNCSYEIADYHAEEHAKRFSNIKVTGGVLREECKALMKNVKNWRLV